MRARLSRTTLECAECGWFLAFYHVPLHDAEGKIILDGNLRPVMEQIFGCLNSECSEHGKNFIVPDIIQLTEKPIVAVTA